MSETQTKNTSAYRLCLREQRNHGLEYESDCVCIRIGIEIFMNRGSFCKRLFLSSTLQSNGNILSVSEQVFIPAVSHKKIANVHVGTIHQNVRIALQFSYTRFITWYNTPSRDWNLIFKAQILIRECRELPSHDLLLEIFENNSCETFGENVFQLFDCANCVQLDISLENLLAKPYCLDCIILALRSKL
jgi:hypothetical protein